MTGRRRPWSWPAVLLAVGLVAAASCGDEGGAMNVSVLSDAPRETPPASTDASQAGASIRAFGFDLFNAVAGATLFLGRILEPAS